MTGRREICEARSKVDAALGDESGLDVNAEAGTVQHHTQSVPSVPLKEEPVYDRQLMEQLRGARGRASAPPVPDDDLPTRLKALETGEHPVIRLNDT